MQGALSGVRVVGCENDAQASAMHLQNVWHYAMECGCYSYSPVHFASAFEILEIEPEKVTSDEERDEHQEYAYHLSYALHPVEKRPRVSLPLPEDMHVHEWFTDIVLHDPMEQFGSYEDGKGKIIQASIAPDDEGFTLSSSKKRKTE
jgi:hypothetical protein